MFKLTIEEIKTIFTREELWEKWRLIQENKSIPSEKKLDYLLDLLEREEYARRNPGSQLVPVKPKKKRYSHSIDTTGMSRAEISLLMFGDSIYRPLGDNDLWTKFASEKTVRALLEKDKPMFAGKPTIYEIRDQVERERRQKREEREKKKEALLTLLYVTPFMEERMRQRKERIEKKREANKKRKEQKLLNAHLMPGMKTLRPMSPHLSIYKPQKGSILSIWHRLSGVIVAFFLLLLFFWIRLLTFFGCWNSIVSFLKLFLLNSIPYWFVLCLIYFVLFLVCYHILNGCRHILSDL